jgi:hypothetical protein
MPSSVLNGYFSHFVAPLVGPILCLNVFCTDFTIGYIYGRVREFVLAGYRCSRPEFVGNCKHANDRALVCGPDIGICGCGFMFRFVG